MTEKTSVKEVIHPMLDPIRAMRLKKGKIVTAEEAVDIIRDGDTVVTAGFIGRVLRKECHSAGGAVPEKPERREI